MKIAIALMILLMIPIATAFPCREMGWKTWLICEGIEKSGMNQDEKDLLVSTMIYSSNKPNHELIEKWDRDINPTHPPYDTETKNSGYIKDAWLEIYGAYPSVEYDNEILFLGMIEFSFGWEF